MKRWEGAFFTGIFDLAEWLDQREQETQNMRLESFAMTESEESYSYAVLISFEEEDES
jgi:hypothetical protein